MNQTLEEMIKIVIEIKSVGKKKVFKKRASELRKKLAKLMDKDEMFVHGWYLLRQKHAWGETVALFSPQAWDKYQIYLHGDPDKKSLDWIKQESLT